jgi:TetR/AcrR family transcriptional repressor of nem operon
VPARVAGESVGRAVRCDAGQTRGCVQTWQSHLATGLRRMQDRGELNVDADVAELAIGVVVAVQGGLILAQAARSEKPLRAALDLAVGRVALAVDVARAADSESRR